MMTATNISTEDMDRIIGRFQALDALRSCPGASDGEKKNATDAIAVLLRKNGLDEDDIIARLNSSGAHNPFYMGNDPKFMRDWKIALLDTIAKAHNCKAVKYQDESCAILFGARFRVNEATDLYKYVVANISRMAEQAFKGRAVRFGDGADNHERDWKFSFHQGALMAIKARLSSRQFEAQEKPERHSDVPQPRDMSPQDIQRYMDDILLNQEILNELYRMFQKQTPPEVEEDKPSYNPLGFYAGREAGLSLALQAEMAA